MAQDFYALFNVGTDNKTISTIDPAGVSLVAIKELYTELLEIKKENDELRSTVNTLKKEVQNIKH